MKKNSPILGTKPFWARDKRLLCASFYDPTGISTVIEYIWMLQALSRHMISVINLWPNHRGSVALPGGIQLDEFDGIIVHPTLSYSPQNLRNIDTELTRKLADYDGLKVLMKQDEQVSPTAFVEIIAEKKFDVLLTCVPKTEQEKVYPQARIGACDKVQLLTGYVSPMMREGRRRKHLLDLTYRGSIQPLAFGRLGYEKRGIGYDVAEALADPDMKIDISSRWEDRVYGDLWFELLASSKAVLGTESGSNLFDFDKSVAAFCAAYEKRTHDVSPLSKEYYDRAHDEFLHLHEGNVNYAQISPRHFEAASTFTLQMLYEGEYSGIFKPHRHFVPLRKDLANLTEALEILRDERVRAQIVECAFEEVICSPQNSYESFVQLFDDCVNFGLEKKGGGKTRRNPSDRKQSEEIRNSISWPAVKSPLRPTAFLLAPMTQV